MSHTPEKWWARGPLSEEEVSRVGGVPPQIVIARSDGEDNPEIVLVVAEFEHESDRDKAIACVNALAGVADPDAQVTKWRAIEAAAREFVAANDEICGSFDGSMEKLDDLRQVLAAKGGE